jgi:hypothetical protein
MRGVIVSHLDDLRPGLALQTKPTPGLLVVVTSEFMLLRGWTVNPVSSSILLSQHESHDGGSAEAEEGEREGDTVAGSETTISQGCMIHSRWRVLTSISLGRDDTSGVTGGEHETHADGLFV